MICIFRGKKMNKMSERKQNKGFTLVELIVVLVILAVLAAILIPALLGWIDRAREKQDLIEAKSALTAIQVALSERYAVNGGTVPEGEPILYLANYGNSQIDFWNTSAKRPNVIKNGNDDINATRQTDNKDKTKTDNFATPILKNIESAKNVDNKQGDPYCIIFGAGSNAVNTSTLSPSTTVHDKYTVYFIFYMKEKDSTPMFYFDGKWSTTFPKTSTGLDAWDENNIVREGSLQGKRLQFFAISNEAWRTENGGYYFPGGDKNANKKTWNWMKSFK